MSATTATVSRWARRYVLVAVAFLLAWQVGTLAGLSKQSEVVFAVHGFVFHVVFGKAYSLVPTYFDRELAFRHAPILQFPLVTTGTAALAASSLQLGPPWLGAMGAVLWTLGVGVFLGALVWSIRTNPTGRETATGSTNADRRTVDRFANAFVPVALLYLLVGTYELLATHTGLPSLLDGYRPRTTHLLAAGAAGTMVFALGFRLLPRFLVVSPPSALVAVVLPAGALGPALLATHLGTSVWFQVGAVVEALAVIGFATAYAIMFVQSARRRVGFYGVLAGAASGIVAVVLGLSFAFGHRSPSLVLAHLRANLLGFLGLTVVGVTYQFYPPAVATLTGGSNRTALVSIMALMAGLFAQIVGLAAGVSTVTTLGELATIAGAVLYGYVLVAVFESK